MSIFADHNGKFYIVFYKFRFVDDDIQWKIFEHKLQRSKGWLDEQNMQKKFMGGHKRLKKTINST